MDTTRSAAAFVEGLQAHGRYTFTEAEAADALDLSARALDAALRRLKKARRLASPRRGFFIVVPVEYRDAGSPPATWFIDALMEYLAQPYYVALLTAASFLGAAHQQPMVFQVMTSVPTRTIGIGRVRIEFRVSRSIEQTPVSEVRTETGTMRLSTPEATAFDLVRYAKAGGGVSQVAEVLAELVERLRAEELESHARSRKTPELQRLGYLLDVVGERRLAEPLLRVLAERRFRPVPLSPESPLGDAAAVVPWRVVPNEAGRDRPVIPRAYITAWRSDAPWPDDAQVEQDLVIARALVELFGRPSLAAALAFRGGTALHKLHFESSGRYSEDIDLVQMEA